LLADARAGDVQSVSGGHDRVRILIADDHPPTRLLLREQLEDAGFEVCGEAASGIEALEIAVRERPDLCLLDVVMPRGDGIVAAAEIKRALPETKVVMVTAAPDEEGVVAAARAGADGYLPKEVDPLRWPEIIRAVAAGESSYPRRLLPHVLAGLRTHRRRRRRSAT
jgi:DNA-binding NarL/FixJ family response regulator